MAWQALALAERIMGPLTIFHGMALAFVAAPNAPQPAPSEAVPVSIAGFTLPASSDSLLSLDASSRPDFVKPLAPVPANDAVELPKFTFRDGGVMEIGAGGLKFDWRF